MLIKKKPKTAYAKNMKMKAWAVARLYGELRLIPGAGLLHSWQIVGSVEMSSELTIQCCVCVCVAVLVKTNEFSLQSLRCLDSAHRIAAPEFSLGRSQAIPQRERVLICPLLSRALFQYSGWMIKCVCFAKRLSACFLPWYDIYLNILRCKIGSLEVPRPFYPLAWRSWIYIWQYKDI